MEDRVLRLPQVAQPSAIDRRALPDPGPYVTADVRRLIDRSHLTFAEVAESVNTACRIGWLDEFVVERWYRGLGFPRLNHARVLLWLAGYDIAELVPDLAGAPR